MLNRVEEDAKTLGMTKEELIEDFLISYGDALANIGFSTREIMKMTSQGLKGA